MLEYPGSVFDRVVPDGKHIGSVKKHVLLNWGIEIFFTLSKERMQTLYVYWKGKSII